MSTGGATRPPDPDAVYAALKTTGQLKSHRVVTYRCPQRCMLLDVLNLPDPLGVVVHIPRYRLSPGLNAQTSSADGRANNTEDGDNHWQGWTAPRAQVSRPELTCKHVMVPLEDEDLDAAISSRRAEVVVYPPGAQSA